MQARPIFPTARLGDGMYESFYLRAFAPQRGLGIWIRNTVHKRPGRPPSASVWCTVFDARREGPVMVKSTSSELTVPAGGWIAIGEETRFGPGFSRGSCGPLTWSLSFATSEPPLRHLRPELLYRAPLPRTKLTSPAPAARFTGTLELPGEGPIELEQWPGMVGHNWGSEHAERWIWLHGTGFEQAPEAWLDIALGRILLAGRMTPWVANGVLSLDGERHRVGGLLGPRPRVSERVDGCAIHLKGHGGLAVDLRAEVPHGMAAGWRYADPDGGEHDVVNCSISAMELDVRGAGTRTARLSTDHGGAYELGMRERDHAVAIAPFPDG